MGASPFAGLHGVLRDGIRALKPYGAAPIVVVLLAAISIAGLAAGGPPIAIIAATSIAFGAFFWAQERSAEWRRREIEVEYDALERKDEAAVRRKLQRRLERIRKRDEPTLFDARGSDHARDH